MEYGQILAILDKWIANMEDEFEVLWLSGRMEVLKKSIDERQSKLFNTWIKIPFTDKYFVDDIGMLPGHGWIPTAVAMDTKKVTEYNRLLKEAQAFIPDMIKTREAIMPEADQALKAIANLPKEQYDRHRQRGPSSHQRIPTSGGQHQARTRQPEPPKSGVQRTGAPCPTD